MNFHRENMPCQGEEKVLAMSASKKRGAMEMDGRCGDNIGLATDVGICAYREGIRTEPTP